MPADSAARVAAIRRCAWSSTDPIGTVIESIGVVAIELGGYIERHKCAFAQRPSARDTVNHLLVDTDADRAGIAVGQDRSGPGSVGREEVRSDLIKLTRRDPGHHRALQSPQSRGDQTPCTP